MRYFIYLIAALIAEVVAVPAAFVLPFFAIGRPVLPRWLSWFQTPDNDLDGDAGWLILHWQWRYKLVPTLCNYVGRVGWLLRNRAYGFKWSVLAAPIDHAPAFNGDPVVNRNNGHFGLLRCWHGNAWQWKWVHPLKRWHLLAIAFSLSLGNFFMGDLCLFMSSIVILIAAEFAKDGVYCWMFNFGWLLDAYIGRPELAKTQPRALFLFSPRIAKIKTH